MNGPNLVLIGFMGSGKSSVGRLLAARLGGRFVDTDALVVRRAGMPITEIFARHGEPEFRRRETEALASFTRRRGIVAATGGGIVTTPANLPLLKQIGPVIWLTADEETIFARVSRNTRRPLLKTPNPRQTIAELLATRRPLYEAAADLTVDTTHRTHEEVANVVIEEAKQRFPWHP